VHAGRTAALAELNGRELHGRVLRALVGLVDHALGRRIASAMFKASSISRVPKVVAIDQPTI
jgi:hypothetical protein